MNLEQLKTAVEQGYYRTEEALDRQEPIPSFPSCGTCPFYEWGTCRIRLAIRGKDAMSCQYYSDVPHGQEIIDARNTDVAHGKYVHTSVDWTDQ